MQSLAGCSRFGDLTVSFASNATELAGGHGAIETHYDNYQTYARP